MTVEISGINKFDVNAWFESAKEGNILASYFGDITSEVITTLVEKSETIFVNNPEISHLKKVSFHIVVECLQNLFHHGLSQGDGKPKFGAFLLLFSENTLKIVTGNYISVEKVQLISDRINQINSMSKDELKTLYKLILNNDEFSEKGGGGLGMIDIARKTGSKLIYEFLPVDEKVLFYILKINII